MPDAIDSSAGTISSAPPTPPPSVPEPESTTTPAPIPEPVAVPIPGPTKAAATAPAPKAPPDPKTPLGVGFGKPINVPNNFLGAGVAGKGWTIVGEHVVNGQRAVILGRRVGQTGAYETHEIDATTYNAAKAYKEEQGGMSKSGKPPVLGANELGKAIDPQGELVPEFFDAATRSYRLRLPGGRTPEWVPESLIRDLRQGKPGALASLRKATKLEDQTTNAASTPSTGAQLAQGVVASAILGKSLATRLGLRNEKQETSIERPSSEVPAPASQKKGTNATDRAAQEAAARQNHLEGKDPDDDEEEEEDEEEKAQGAVYRTNTYTATNKAGESAQVRSENPNAEAGLRIGTNKNTPGMVRLGTPLAIATSEATTPSAETIETNGTQTTSEPLQAVRAQGPKNRDRKKAGNEKAPSIQDRYAKIDPVQATLDKTAARKTKQEAQTVEARFRALSSNPEFKSLLTKDVTQVVQNERQQMMQQALSNWDKHQREKKTAHIEKSYSALAVNPAFRQVDQEIRAQGNVSTQTEIQLKEQALQTWHARQSSQAGLRSAPRAPRAVTASQAIRKNAPTGRTKKPITLDGLADITKTAGEQKDIRQMRAFLQAQQKSRSSSGSYTGTSPSTKQGAGASGTLFGAFAGLRTLQTAAPAQASANAGNPLEAALHGLSREQALAQVERAEEVQATQLEGMRLWQSAPDAQSSQTETTGTSATSSNATVASQIPESSPTSTPTDPLPPSSPPSPTSATVGQEATPSELELAAAIAAASQALDHLRAVKNQLSALPEGSAVPNTFAVADPNEVASALAEDENVAEAPEANAGDTNLAPPLTPNQPHTEATAASKQEPPRPAGTRVGAPPVRRHPPSRPPQSAWSKIKQHATLPLAFGAMANLGSAQAFEQNQDNNDPREAMLAADSSVSGENVGPAPVISGTHRQGSSSPSQEQEEGEDVQKSTQEEAQEMREAGEQERANQAQFSGTESQTKPDGGENNQEDQGPAPAGPQAPAQQMQAAQQQERKKNQEYDRLHPPSTWQPSTTWQARTEKNVKQSQTTVARLTKIKLGADLVEGAFDGLGFIEFLGEANLALVNDRYLHSSILPSLKNPELPESAERYMGYGIMILDVLLFFLVGLYICIAIAAIVLITCSAAAVACAVAALT